MSTRRGRLITTLLILGAALAAASTARADCGVALTGRWLCKTHDSKVPLSFVHLELWDSDCYGSSICDDRMDLRDPATGDDRPEYSAFTGYDGRFEINGWGGDYAGTTGWAPPEPYVTALLTNAVAPRVSLQDELGRIRSSTSGEHRFDDVCGSFDVGDLVFDGDAGKGEITRCELFLEARRVANDYYNIMQSEPNYGEVRLVVWLIAAGGTYTDYDMIRWTPGKDPIATDDSGRTMSLVGHEFAHSLYFTLDGSRTHWSGDVAAFRYASRHDQCDEHFTAGFIDYQRRGYSFSEGWADYWQGAWEGCGLCPNGGSCVPVLEQNADCGNGCGGQMYTPVTCGCATHFEDTTNYEGNVARAVKLLETGCKLSRKQLVEIFAANPGQIHSFEEYYDKVRAAYPDCSINLTGVASAASGLKAPLLENDYDLALAKAITGRELGLLSQAAASLKKQLNPSRTVARQPCDFTTTDCAQRQIAPWTLWGAYRLAKLEMQRRKTLHVSKLPYDPIDGKHLSKTKTAFTKAIGKVLIKVFSKSQTAVAKLNGDYTAVLQKLQDREQGIRQALAAGGDLPAYAYDLTALDALVRGSPTPSATPTLTVAVPTATPTRAPAAPTTTRPPATSTPRPAPTATTGPPCGSVGDTCGGTCPAGQTCQLVFAEFFVCKCQ